MTTIYLIRHAEAEGNVYRRFHGWYNSLITVNGYRQIEALAQRFRDVHIDAVYSSDLYRTMTTASAIYVPKQRPLRLDADLREIGGGVWEDKPWGELRRSAPQLLSAFNAAHPDWQVEGSETFAAVQDRVSQAIARIAAAHEGQTVAIFSHGTAIRCAMAKFYGYPVEEIARLHHGDNTSVSKLTFRDGVPTVEYYNDTRHLGTLSTMGKQRWWHSKDPEEYGRYNLWFRPLDFTAEEAFYRQARQDAWQSIYGTLDGCNEDKFAAEARKHSDYFPTSVLVAMQNQTPAGILQLDLRHEADQCVGHIPFLYLLPHAQGKGLGVQLLGQAVSAYRPLGRQFLRLHCAPEHTVGHRFYTSHGFRKVGEAPGGIGGLETLEAYIGYGKV